MNNTASTGKSTGMTAALAVPLALAGTFVSNLGAQSVGAHIARIQAGLGLDVDAASWITTLYTVAIFIAFTLSPLLARTLGIRRLFLASALAFAASAAASALAPGLPALLVARVAQGFAGGMFGPIAFVAIFRLWNGPRLPLGFALLALVLLVSFNAGPVLSRSIEAAYGWRALFLAQTLLAAPLLLLGLRWLPQGPVNAAGHKREWFALALWAVATASLVVLFSQGARRGWFDSTLIVSMAIVSLGAWIGFFVVHSSLVIRLLHGRKLLDRRFGIPIALNFVFRGSFAATVYLLPLLLATTHRQGLASTSWLLIPQLVSFPLVWRWMQHVDHRVPMALGLLLTAIGTGFAGFATTLEPSLAMIGIGQMSFLVPALVTGAHSLKPEHGPTATIAFNMTTVGGTTLAVALLSTFIGARMAYHDAAWPAINEAFFVLAGVLLLAMPFVGFIGRTVSATLHAQENRLDLKAARPETPSFDDCVQATVVSEVP
jgi:DHA2 family multidrug resistance protein